MEFRKLRESDYPALLALYTDAFPPDERRDYEGEEALGRFIRDKGGKFNAFVADDGGLFLGFMTYWTFEGYVYVEHFAVNPEVRGKRIGTLMLKHLLKETDGKILIEVELPGTPESDRRIRFYERNGFRRRDEIEYLQPPYSADKKPVGMLLMTHGDVPVHEVRDLDEMLREVYGAKR